MKKALALFSLACLLFVPVATAGTWPFGGYKQQYDATNIEVDQTNLDNNCAGATTVQECLDLLDEAAGGGGSGDITAVVAGNGLTGGATSGSATLDIGEGLAIDVAADSVAFDPTELTGNRTWSDGSGAAINWTYDLSGTDVVLGFSSGALAITGNLSASNLSGTNTGDQDLSGLQPLDADLTYLAGFTPTANVKSILNAADYAAIRALLDLEAGTDFYSKAAADAAFQPLDSDLTYLAGFTPSANVKTILNAADYDAIRTALTLTIGTNVQAWDADLDYLATFTPSANVKSILNAADYAAIRALLDLEAGTDFYSKAAADAAFQALDADLTTLASPGNWKVFYSNGSGNIVALAIGANGKVLKSNGTTSAPSWEDDSTGSGSLGTSLSSSTNDVLSSDGSVVFGGTGGTNNEKIEWDFETSANTVDVLTSTGVTIFDFSDFDLKVSDESYDATNWNGSLEVPTKNAVRDKIQAITYRTCLSSNTSFSATSYIPWAGGDSNTSATARNWGQNNVAITITAVEASVLTASSGSGSWDVCAHENGSTNTACVTLNNVKTNRASGLSEAISTGVALQWVFTETGTASSTGGEQVCYEWQYT